MVLTLECAEFRALVRIRADEPELTNLERGLEGVSLGDVITLSHSGRLAVGDGLPSPKVEPRALTLNEQVDLCDGIVERFRARQAKRSTFRR